MTQSPQVSYQFNVSKFKTYRDVYWTSDETQNWHTIDVFADELKYIYTLTLMFRNVDVTAPT